MTNEEKIVKIQDIIEHPSTVGAYYELMEDLGDFKKNYGDYLLSASIDCDREMERLPDADYELSTALFTMLLREDHFCEGSFEERLKSGQVNAVLKRMIETLKNDPREADQVCNPCTNFYVVDGL